jgi:putative FmdB family regulatory protein
MPLYEYECKKCGARFEHLVFNREDKVTCTSCGSQNLMRLLSTFAVASSEAASASKFEPGPCGACGAPQRGMCQTGD